MPLAPSNFGTAPLTSLAHPRPGATAPRLYSNLTPVGRPSYARVAPARGSSGCRLDSIDLPGEPADPEGHGPGHMETIVEKFRRSSTAGVPSRAALPGRTAVHGDVGGSPRVSRLSDAGVTNNARGAASVRASLGAQDNKPVLIQLGDGNCVLAPANAPTWIGDGEASGARAETSQDGTQGSSSGQTIKVTTGASLKNLLDKPAQPAGLPVPRRPSAAMDDKHGLSAMRRTTTPRSSQGRSSGVVDAAGQRVPSLRPALRPAGESVLASGSSLRPEKNRRVSFNPAQVGDAVGTFSRRPTLDALHSVELDAAGSEASSSKSRRATTLGFLRQARKDSARARRTTIAPDEPVTAIPAAGASREEVLKALHSMTLEAALAPEPRPDEAKKERRSWLASIRGERVAFGEGHGKFASKHTYFPLNDGRYKAYLRDVQGLTRIWVEAVAADDARDGAVMRSTLAAIAARRESEALMAHPQVLRATVARMASRAGAHGPTATLRELLCGAYDHATPVELTLLQCEVIALWHGGDDCFGLSEEEFKALAHMMAALETFLGISGQGLPADALGNVALGVHGVAETAHMRVMHTRMKTLEARHGGRHLDFRGIVDWWLNVNAHSGFALTLPIVKSLGAPKSTLLREALRTFQANLQRSMDEAGDDGLRDVGSELDRSLSRGKPRRRKSLPV